MVRNVNYVFIGSEMFCFRAVALWKMHVISIMVLLFDEDI
jgi:hypothetical protein